MGRVSLKGVVIGSVTDIVTTSLLTVLLAIYVIVTRNLLGIPKDQVSKVLLQLLHNDPVLFSTKLLLGSICSVLGGYVAAHIAKRHELLNGSLAAFLCVASGLYALLFGPASAPIWRYLVGFAASAALSTFGGYLRSKVVHARSNV